MSRANSLPGQWAVCRLGEVAEFIMGQAPPGAACNKDGRGTVFVKAGEFGRDDYPVVREWTTKPLREARAGDVLICVVGATAGKLNLAIDAAIGRSVAAIRPPSGLATKYLYFFLHPLVESLRSGSKGSAQGVISKTELHDIELLLPPANEQTRIVEAIESYFTRLDNAVATLERVQANLKRYRASVLKAAVEGGLVPTEAELARQEGRDYEPASELLKRILAERRRRWEEAELAALKTKGKKSKDDKWKAKYTEPVSPDTSELPDLPEGWCWGTLDALATTQTGLAKGKKRKATQTVRHVPYLRVANVQRGWLDLAEMKEIEATEEEIAVLRLEPGDVLFNEGGDRDKLGRGWIWQGQIEECIHQNHVHRARLLTSDLRPKFVSWFGNTYGQVYFFREGKQTTNLASVSMSKLKSLPIPIPPVREQERIELEVERLLSVVDDSESSVSMQLRRSTALRHSILKWAFEGKLADQDSNDEPASALLERIKAEREGNAVEAKPKSRVERNGRKRSAA